MSKIEIKNLNKAYGEKQVLKNITLNIEHGKIYGLLGENGAGKTTLLNIINNRTLFNSGEVLIEGEAVSENSKGISKIYYMNDKDLVPEDMKIADLFKWTKEFYEGFDIEYAKSLSVRFKLDIKKKYKSLSTGYKSIAKVITCLASGADYMFFDEPVLGLDAKHRDMFYKEVLKIYAEKENTILISTHIIEEVSDLLERVIIIKDGVIIKDEEVETLLGTAYSVSGKGTDVESYINGKEVVSVEVLGGYKKATIVGEKANKEEIKKLGLEEGKVELQKLFISLTSEGEE